MSQEANPNSNSMSDRTFLTLTLAALPCLLYFRYQTVLFAWWASHRTVLIICAGTFSTLVVAVLASLIWNRYVDTVNDQSITKKDSTSVYLGRDEKNRNVHLKEEFRTLHTHVLGTTNAGKTESIILPWAIQDIENGSGMLIVDGKADTAFLQKLYSYVDKHGREKDFRFFSLAHLEPSCTYNPLLGDSPHEVAERVFSSIPMENAYYKAVQQKIFFATLSLIRSRDRVATFALVNRILTNPTELSKWLTDAPAGPARDILSTFNALSAEKRADQISGLESYLSQFILSTPAPLFNQPESDIKFDEVLKNNLICYFQLPTMYYPALAEATGKLVLQSFQSAVAKRQMGIEGRAKFFSCFLDDFQDYIYPGFAALLNKARSANIGVCFSHQSLGDLDKVGPDFRNTVVTCTNIKVIMRNNEPDTCEFYAKSFGTQLSEKVTERQIKGTLSDTRTGEGSVREVKEYIFHPDEIKQLERGQALVAIPHPEGVKALKIRLQRRPDLEPVTLPILEKSPALFYDSLPQVPPAQTDSPNIIGP